MIADRARNAGKGPGLVDGGDGQLGREQLLAGGVDVPTDVEPAFRLIVESDQRRRLDRIDGDAFSGREDPDDAVSRDRAAIGREAHRQVARLTPDGDRPVRLGGTRGHLEAEVLRLLETEPAGVALLRSGAGLARLDDLGMDGPDHIARKHLAAPDRGQHVVRRGTRQARERGPELVLGEGLAVAFEGTGQDLAAEPRILGPDGSPRGSADRRTGLAGGDQGFPSRRRGPGLRRRRSPPRRHWRVRRGSAPSGRSPWRPRPCCRYRCGPHRRSRSGSRLSARR